MPHIPVLETLGIVHGLPGTSPTVSQMRAPATLLDQDGVTASGALAVLADSVLGFAVMSTVAQQLGMVTTHLHLELLRALPAGAIILDAVGRQCGIEGRFGIGAGDIATADGCPIAQATIGALLLERRPPDEHPAAHPEVPAVAGSRRRLIGDAPVHQLLGTRVRRAGRSGVRLTMEARPGLANSQGGVHGGVGVLMGERALDLALRAAISDDRRLRPVELRAAFLRPIAADGRAVECHAAVMHLGRRLAAVRGEVRDHDGRTAVLVDATYVGV